MRSGLPGTGTGTTQWFRKTWRKLHLSRGNILTSEPTTEHVGDETVAARSSRTLSTHRLVHGFQIAGRLLSHPKSMSGLSTEPAYRACCRTLPHSLAGCGRRQPEIRDRNSEGRRKPVISDWRHAKNTEKQTIEKHSRQRWTECQPSGGQTANASGADS